MFWSLPPAVEVFFCHALSRSCLFVDSVLNCSGDLCWCFTEFGWCFTGYCWCFTGHFHQILDTWWRKKMAQGSGFRRSVSLISRPVRHLASSLPFQSPTIRWLSFFANLFFCNRSFLCDHKQLNSRKITLVKLSTLAKSLWSLKEQKLTLVVPS